MMKHDAISDNGTNVRHRLADALESCMRDAPLEKITVRQITDTCGVSRQTFYRNFTDKYDLLNCYFDELLNKSFQHMGYGNTAYDSLVHKFTYIQEEKLFFKAAFKNDDQNCLRDHDFQLITAFYTDQIESRTGKKISPHLQFQLEMYCQGSIFMTVQWVLGYRKCTPEELARSLAGAMPAELSDVFREVGLI